MTYRICLLFLFLLSNSVARAFVENVTHGYVNCMACHVSPGGGGLLNEYGRSLSRELMSTWGWKGSEEPLFGAAKNLDWLTFGGDIRSLQTYFENSQIKQGRQFWMQQNIELGVRAGKLLIVGALGVQGGPENTPGKDKFLSERHYLLWETSAEDRVRVGKFRTNFGLYDPNHTRVTKSPLGFGSNSETYNLEFSKFTDDDEIFLTAGLGRLDLPRDSSSERNLVFSYARYINGAGKLGGSLLTGESSRLRRNLFGLFAVLPFLEKGIFKFETDYQRSTASTTPDSSQDLATAYASFGFQTAKGLLSYVFFEYLHQDLSDSKTLQSSPGVGIQWLPIPHVELQAEYKRQTLQSAADQPNNVGWFLVHLYL